jgi:hypothetical protein
VRYWTYLWRKSCNLLPGSTVCTVLIIVLMGPAFHASGAPLSFNVGVFSFDVLNPGTAGTPGQNQFVVNNFTGSNALPPDFPVVNALTLKNVSIDLGSGLISLPDVGPGSVEPVPLTFLDTMPFASAMFHANIDASQLSLADGTTVQLTSNLITAVIAPSQGVDLSPGIDFALITVDGTVVSSPEPSSVVFVLMSFLLLFGFAGSHLRSTNGPKAKARQGNNSSLTND